MATGRIGKGARGRPHRAPVYALPTERTTTWAAGISGGVPSRTTIYTTLQAADYTGVNASTAINAAVAACPANQVVLLSPGTFIANDLILINKAIVLRGAGASLTILEKTNGAHARTNTTTPVDPGTYGYEAEPIIIVGPQRWNVFDDTTSQALTVDGAKGAFTVTVSDASGFTAGEFVMLDELSGATWQATPTAFPDTALVWQGDRVAWNMHLPVQVFQDDTADADATGPYLALGPPRTLPPSMAWFAREDRPVNEVKEIASKNGNVITFTTPLHIGYRTSKTAQLTRATGANVFIQGAGVEDIATKGGADGQVRFTHAAKCWAQNIEVTQWIGEGVAVDASFKIELRDSYLHTGSWPVPGGGGYAISLAYGSSEVLVENCVIVDTNKIMVARSSGSGSVVAYNYTDDSWIFGTSGWQEVGINASHMTGPHHVLFEGNYSPNADSDYTHGSACYLTFFRNHLSGFRARADLTETDNQRCAGLAYGSWWDSFVGNVLGLSGQMSGWNYAASAMGGSNATWTGPNIWQLGYDPERWVSYADPVTLSTVIRDGNYDHLTSTQQWHSSSAQSLPDSLYLSSKPAFFGVAAWPWVNPVTGVTTTLPAKLRYDNATPNDTTPPADTTVVTIGQNTSNTYAGFEDTDVRDDGGAINGNFHTDATCFVSKYATGDFRTNLIRVTGLTNLSGLTVVNAKLKWKVVNGAIDPVTLTLRRMLRPWVVSEATGNIWSTGNNWTSVMGVSNGNDRSSTVTCAVAVGLVNQYYEFTSAQFILDVQDMVDNPATNYGWDQERTDGANDTGYREFTSSNGTDGSRPELEVTVSA